MIANDNPTALGYCQGECQAGTDNLLELVEFSGGLLEQVGTSYADRLSSHELAACLPKVAELQQTLRFIDDMVRTALAGRAKARA